MTTRAYRASLRASGLLIVVAGALAGCALQKNEPMTSVEARRVDILNRLDAASSLAVNAQREFAMTNDGRVQRQMAERKRLLTDEVSYDFYGDVEEILRDISTKYGYELKVYGRRPAERVNVNVYVKKMPVIEVLRYIGMTAGDWLDVSVKQGVIALTYKSARA